MTIEKMKEAKEVLEKRYECKIEEARNAGDEESAIARLIEAIAFREQIKALKAEIAWSAKSK